MPESAQGFRWTDLAITLSAGVGSFVLCAMLVIALAIQGQINTQQEKLNTVLSGTKATVQESKAIINRLNALGFDHCTRETLDAMQRELFLANRIRDIGFVKDNVVLCTTGHGILETPFEQNPWDYIEEDGFKYWPAAPMILFGGEITAPIVEHGQFNVVIDTRWLERQANQGSRLELIYRNKPSNSHYTYGDAGVFRGLNGEAQHSMSATTLYTEACTQELPYCAGLETNNLQMLKRNRSFATLLVIIGIAFGAGAGRITWLALEKRRSTMSRVIRGVKQKYYYPLYQPIVDLRSGETVGCEVLARFYDSHGAIYPDTFIPLLGQAHLSWKFTEIIIQKTLDDLEPRKYLPDGFTVHINLYPSDIALGRLKSAQIAKALVQSHFQIVFEITEDEQLNTAAAQDCLEWIRQNGFKLSIDDFGTGYSNLSKVRDLECNTLKIDRSFIFDIDRGGLGHALVPLIIKIGHESGMEIVAEGVETPRQADILRDMGARYAQGWAFGKPMPAESLDASMR